MKCSVADCQNKCYGKGFCSFHWVRQRYGRDLTAPKKASHGLSGRNRLYQVWENLKQRCLNPKNTAYQYYGGRGVTICGEWRDNYIAFHDWAKSSGYRDDLTLDRMDTDGGYDPGNCRWVTRKEQQNNLRTNVIVEFRGQKKTLMQWSEEVGIRWQTLRGRMNYGWSTERLLTTPPDPRFRAKSKEPSRA